MSRIAGMWKRRVKVWGFLGAKMLSKAIRQYNRASALSQRSNSLKQRKKTDFEHKYSMHVYNVLFHDTACYL